METNIKLKIINKMLISIQKDRKKYIELIFSNMGEKESLNKSTKSNAVSFKKYVLVKSTI